MEESRLLSYLDGELSEQEAQEVESWVAQSEENHQLLEQIYYTSHLVKSMDAYQGANVEAALEKFRARVADTTVAMTPVRKLGWWKRYGVAVAAFFTGLIVASSVLFAFHDAQSVYEVSTLPNQRAQVVLPDGTAVWLNASTKLSYSSNWISGERCARLQGEAYFEVKKNSLRPFVVHSQEVRTRVLGTKFNVRARQDEHEVVTTLFQGAVQMYSSPQDANGVCLSPGETLTVDTETKQVNMRTLNHPEEVLLWIKGKMRFDNASLEKIMDCLSKIYNVKVTFENDQLKNERFTCQFKTDTSLDKVLSTLSLTQHFSYVHQDNHVYIQAVK